MPIGNCMVSHHTSVARLLDHLLDEVETGHADEAVLLAAGMMDRAMSDPSSARDFRDTLLAHPLHPFLIQASRSHAEIANSADGIDDKHFGSSLRCLGSTRAGKARSEITTQWVTEAWKQGKNICLLDCGLNGELEALSHCDLSNIAIVHPDQQKLEAASSQMSQPFQALTADPVSYEPTTRYDLIIAPRVADAMTQAALSRWLSRWSDSVSQDGALCISSFVPGHLGLGWQSICMGRTVNCHDEAALQQAALVARLTTHTIRDASNSLVWAEMRSGASATNMGKTKNGHVIRHKGDR